MAIEVEQKFSVARDTRDRLAAIGATKKDYKSFVDIYYDTSDHSLTFDDFWLRQRDGSWELKSPLASHDSKPLTDKYKETDIEHDILELLIESRKLPPGEQSLSQLVHCGVLEPIAELTTHRERWLLRDPGVEGLSGANVVLDSTNRGYEIGEVELMAGEPSLVAKAEEFVRDMAARIGISV